MSLFQQAMRVLAHPAVLVLAAGAALSGEAGGRPATTSSEPERRAAPWSDEVIELFASLPVQHGGRVKPMDSLAGLKLLTLNGKRSVVLEDGSRISHVTWLLDCLFFPEQARDYPCFRVQNAAVLTAVGLEPKSKRAWYSYHDLAPQRGEVFRLAATYERIEAKDQTALERQVLKLARDLTEFERLTHEFDPLRRHYATATSEVLVGVYGSAASNPLSSVLRGALDLRRLSEEVETRQDAGLMGLLGELTQVINTTDPAVPLFPPSREAAEAEVWWSVLEVVQSAFDPHLRSDLHFDLLSSLERMVEAPGDAATFREALRSLHAGLRALAEARREYSHIPLELNLNRWKPFSNSLVFFLLGFVLTAFGWLWPRKRSLWGASWGATAVAILLVAFGITLRCIIRARPPVVSLYDTILFITGCTSLVCLFLERLTKQRLYLSMATVLGAAGMFLAGRYELKEVLSAGDTMASVVAVLDTNYYLAIHVTTIAMGYSGGLLAAAIAHVWIIGRLVGYRRGDRAFYHSVTRMTYGVLCFSLLFSIFGTIMGGVWANDSWGRFWGWDPKENGALLICLWQLLILHARIGGYIRARGLAVLAIIGGVIVSASWWGVNLLAVGLHSYGFTSGVALGLFAFWGVEGLVLVLCGVDHLRRRHELEEAPA